MSGHPQDNGAAGAPGERKSARPCARKRRQHTRVRIFLAVLAAAAAAGCAGRDNTEVTIHRADGSRVDVRTAADMNAFAHDDKTGSGGGLGGALTGRVETSRESAFRELAKPGSITVGEGNDKITIAGLQHSTTVARHWDGATSFVRNIMSGLVARDTVAAVADGVAENAATDRAGQAAEVRRTEINTRAATEQARIRAAATAAP